MINPIKTLCGLLGRFIIEHGSADIQTKHIALLREQLTLCNQKTIDLEKKIHILETTNKQQESEITNLRLKIKETENLCNELQDKLSKHNLPPASASSPSEPDDYRQNKNITIGRVFYTHDPDLDKIK